MLPEPLYPLVVIYFLCSSGLCFHVYREFEKVHVLCMGDGVPLYFVLDKILNLTQSLNPSIRPVFHPVLSSGMFLSPSPSHILAHYYCICTHTYRHKGLIMQEFVAFLFVCVCVCLCVSCDAML